MQETENQKEVKVDIAELKRSYLKLALNCKAAGIRVNPATVQEYLKKLQTLETQLV